MPLVNRIDRIAEELRKEISQIILFELRDTKLGFITITRATVSPDLQYAKIYLTVLGTPEDLQSNLKRLNDASGYIHHLLIKRIKMRYVPHLSFHFDDSVEKEMRLAKLFDEIEKQNKQIAEAAQPAPVPEPKQKTSTKSKRTAQPVAKKTAKRTPSANRTKK